ncbi:probable protein S-acyltransferase 16 isoform X2 [Rutidosis leptorrhynchoides]|uniref:probable protein S-acyltransferase 16 isoform X2 n=1 Tax=Rutidosis leptorrhynchoides TaxID=125765 RepID=UPI003A994D2D
MARGKASAHVIVVSVTIVYIYFSTVLVFVSKWFGVLSSPGIMNGTVFTAVAVMCIYNYVVAMFTDPGRVPPSFAPDIEDSDHPIHEIKRKGGDLRYCKKCSVYKPPRSHHCRICKRCILRMILLVGSLTVDTHQTEESFRIVYIISGLLLIPLSMALSVFLGWHVYLIIQNKTTIEYYEGVRAMLLAEQGGNVYSHPYDLGVYENLITVLGPNIICWICPVSSYIGSGLRFQTIYDDTLSTSTG